MRRILLCNLILLSLVGQSVLGETARAETNTLTVESLVSEALEKNPELNFYKAEIIAAKAGRKSAGALPNPEFTGTVGGKRARDNSSGLSKEGVAWSVSVAQPLEWPGRMGLRKAIANRDIELAELGYARFKIALAARVRTLAYGVFVAQEKAIAAREVAERFTALREIAVQRDPAGVTPMLETRVLEATELSLQRKATDAELAIQTALLELNQLRGVPAETHFAVQRIDFAFRSPDSRQALLTLGRTNNFELRERAVEWTQQGFRVDLAKNERFPTLTVGPNYSDENALERERTIGMGISFPLPLWNRNTANIEAAAARQMQAEISYALTLQETDRKVIEAALTYETKLREMSRWQPETAERFREAAELADRHYRLGAVPVTVYVELQKQYLEAVENVLDTKREVLDAAQSLELLTGLMPPLVNTKAP